MTSIDFKSAARSRQLMPYFQPIVDLQTGVIIALEARARYDNGMGKELYPGDLITMAQKAGEHWTLDQAILEQVLAMIPSIPGSLREKLTVSVNISIGSCLDRAVHAQLEKLLADAGARARRLRFEIPYVAIKSDSVLVGSLIRILVEKIGVEVVIDHVDSNEFADVDLIGSLIKKVKLDEALVASTPSDLVSIGALHDICRAAQEAGITVAAEGLVRLRQIAFLAHVGCHEGQGSLLGRPYPLGYLRPLLEKGCCW